MKDDSGDFVLTDHRKFELVCTSAMSGRPYLELTQLEILKLIMALKRINNKTLGMKLIKLIKKVDEIEDEKTDFKRDLPRKTNGRVVAEWQSI